MISSRATLLARKVVGTQAISFTHCARTFSSGAGQSSLDEELPGVPIGQGTSFQAEQSAQVTTLSNGVRVISQDIAGQSTFISAAVEAGSRYAKAGAAHFFEEAAFKSTENRSHLRFTRDIEDIGATTSAQAGREAITYSVSTQRDNAGAAVALLSESIVSPRLVDWEINDIKGRLAAETDDLSTNPQAILTESLFAAAYGDTSPLGRSMYAGNLSLPALNATSLANIHSCLFTAPRLVLAATGLAHEELVAAAEAGFGALSSDAGPTASADQYLGGESRTAAASEFTHIAFAFNAPGSSSADAAAAAVLQALWGGALSSLASTEGIAAADSFSAVQRNTGLIGIYAQLTNGAAAEAIAASLTGLAAAPSAEALSAAVAKAKVSLLGASSERQALAGSLATQLLANGEAASAATLAANLDAVTAADVGRIASTALSGPLTVASVGDMTSVSSRDSLAALL